MCVTTISLSDAEGVLQQLLPRGMVILNRVGERKKFTRMERKSACEKERERMAI